MTAKKSTQSKTTALQREKKPTVTEWFSSGCTILDLAVADKLPGGFPAGRITHIFGDPSTTKSVLALEPLGAAQRKVGKAFLLDVECSLDYDWAELQGVKVYDRDKNGQPKVDKEGRYILRKDFCIENPNTIEETFDNIFKKIFKDIDKDNLKNKCAVSIDSLTGLSAESDLGRDLKEPTYGGDRAKRFGEAYRRTLRMIFDKGLCVIVIDQLRDDMKTGGKRYSGGRAVSFYSDVQILLDLTGQKILNERGVIIGIEVGFLIKKNKVATPFREGKFRFLFAEGIDDIGTSIQWLKDNKEIDKEKLEEMRQEIVDKYKDSLLYRTASKLKRKVDSEFKKAVKAAGSREWYNFCGVKKQSLQEMIDFIKRKDLEVRLRKEVYKRWQQIYKPATITKEKARF